LNWRGFFSIARFHAIEKRAQRRFLASRFSKLFDLSSPDFDDVGPGFPQLRFSHSVHACRYPARECAMAS
jgi:hypothetical protein